MFEGVLRVVVGVFCRCFTFVSKLFLGVVFRVDSKVVFRIVSWVVFCSFFFGGGESCLSRCFEGLC